MFPVIWNNWYGRKQERTLCFTTTGYQRKLDQAVRATHNYSDIERVEWNSTGSIIIYFQNGQQEHYLSSRQAADIAAYFKNHISKVNQVE